MNVPTMSLTSKIVIAFLFISLLPLVILSVVNQQNLKRNLTENANKTLFTTAIQTATRLDTFMMTNLELVDTIAHLPDVVNFLSIPPNERPGASDLREMTRVLRNKDTKYISAYVLLDAQGNIVAEDDQYGRSGKNESEQDYFKIPMETGQGYISPVQYDEDKEVGLWYFSVPVTNLLGQPIGVLYMRYDASVLQDLITPSNMMNQVSSIPIVLDDNFTYLAHASHPELIHQALTNGNLKTILQQTNEQAFFTTNQFDAINQTHQIAVMPLQSQPWLVVIAEPEAIFLAPIQAQLQTTIMLVTMIAGIVAITAFGVGQALARPLVNLAQTMTLFTKGNLDIRSDFSSGDERGVLADSFNKMAGQLSRLVHNLEKRTAELETEIQIREQAEGELQKYREHLEQLVTQRTTELQQTVHELDQSQKLLQTVIDSTPDLIFAKDNQFRLILVNQSFAKALGLSPTMVLGKRDAELGIPDYLIQGDAQNGDSGFMQDDQMVLSGETLYRPYDPNLKLSNTDRCFDTYKVPLRDETGKIIGIVGYSRDITELQATEEALRTARDEAEAANQSKSNFLANVSHELRTPLTSVLGFAKVIQKRLEERLLPRLMDDDPKIKRAKQQVRQNIGIIITEGQRLTDLINEVLDLAKIEANQIQWHMEPLQLEPLIERAINNISVLASQKSLALITDIEPNLPLVMGDRDRLLQVLINLLSNAIKFTDVGQISCQATSHETELVIKVIDTGVGITKADQSTVFNEFEQVGETLTDKPQGTGLGLAICREIIIRHGGHIGVESDVGQGSTFFFTLPVEV